MDDGEKVLRDDLTEFFLKSWGEAPERNGSRGKKFALEGKLKKTTSRHGAGR